MSDTSSADFRPRPAQVAAHDFEIALDAAKRAHEASQPGAPQLTDMERKQLELEQAEAAGDDARAARVRLELGLALEQQKDTEKRAEQAEAARQMIAQDDHPRGA